MAFYKYFWDLTNATVGQTHTVGSFDNNTTTGGGTFKWVPASGPLPPDIAGMRIRSITNQGYWERVWEGPLNVSWFGCQNVEDSFNFTAPYTFGQLGISQATLNKRYGTGLVTTNDVYDTAAIKYAFDQMDKNEGWTSIEFEPKVHWISSQCNLPVQTYGNNTVAPGLIIINGNGAKLYKVDNGVDYNFFVRNPQGITNPFALGKYEKQSYVIENFIGNYSPWQGVTNFAGATFLNLAITNNSTIQNIHLMHFYRGFSLENDKFATLDNLTFFQVPQPIVMSSGNYFGANPFTTGCDFSTIKNVIVQYDINTKGSGITITDSGNCTIENVSFISNGGFDTCILISSASPTIKGGTIRNITHNALNIPTDFTFIGITLYGNTVGNQNWTIDNVSSNQTSEVFVRGYALSSTVTLEINLKNSTFPTGSYLFNQVFNILDPLKIGWNLQNVRFGPTITTAADVVNVANNLWATTVGPFIGAYPTVTEVVYTPPILP